MIVLDTQVLLYAVGSEHPLAETCEGLIRAIGEKRVRATTTVQVIQEFAHVRARRRQRDDAASLAVAYADLLSPLLSVEIDALRRGLDRFRTLRTLDAFDAVLGEAAIQAGATALVTADRAFEELSGLPVWRPDGPEVAAAIRA